MLTAFAVPAKPYSPQAQHSASAHTAATPLDLRAANLPVRIDRIEGCSCWTGPDGYIQQKYKFHIEVDSNYRQPIRIDGGVDSNLRILVAYPSEYEPVQMITDHSKIEHRGMQLASPEGKTVDVTSSVIDSEAWRIPELSETMGVPDNWSVWALAANPHGVAQRIYRDPDLPACSFIHSFPSYVEKSILNAGETYYSWEKGVGVWSFNIPMPEDILLQSPSFQDITPRWWTRTEDGQWIGYFPG